MSLTIDLHYLHTNIAIRKVSLDKKYEIYFYEIIFRKRICNIEYFFFLLGIIMICCFGKIC